MWKKIIKDIFKNNENTDYLDEKYKIYPYKEAIIIGLTYLLFGILWIWLSDKILDLIISDIDLYSKIQTLKGGIYVSITSGLIFLLVYKRADNIKKAIIELRQTYKNLQNLHNELIISEENLKNSFYFDSLTNLLSRNGLEFEIKKLIEIDKSFSFIYIDFDNFKNINNTLGYSVGNIFLKEMAEKLFSYVSSKGFAGRLGGDEFALVISNDFSTLNLSSEIKRIYECIGKKWEINSLEFFISISMGISIFPNDTKNLEEIFRNAELAMNRAKTEGKGRTIFFTGEILNNNSETINYANSLFNAIENDEFELYYQAKFDLESGGIIGCEALIRWFHPVYGFISPAVFIPIAEETGQIYTIEKWIFTKALQQKLEFESRGYYNMDISINLSSKTLMSNINFEELEEILARYKVDYSKIIIEVTETSLISDIEFAITRLKLLKKYGIKIALDDFGTGYSSLTYLKRLPIDIIKLDKSFIRYIEKKGKDCYIIKSIISLAKDLEYEVVAEGIETKEQYIFLRDNNCDSAQGYLLAKPNNSHVILDMLDKKYKYVF